MPCGEILQLSNRLTPCPTSSAARDWTPSERSGLRGRTRRTPAWGILESRQFSCECRCRQCLSVHCPWGFRCAATAEDLKWQPGPAWWTEACIWTLLIFLSFCLFCRLIHFFCLFFTWDYHLQEDTSLPARPPALPCHIHNRLLVQSAHCMFQPFRLSGHIIYNKLHTEVASELYSDTKTPYPLLPSTAYDFRSGGIPTEQSHRTKNGASPPFRRAAPFLGAGLPKRKRPHSVPYFPFLC